MSGGRVLECFKKYTDCASEEGQSQLFPLVKRCARIPRITSPKLPHQSHEQHKVEQLPAKLAKLQLTSKPAPRAVGVRVVKSGINHPAIERDGSIVISLTVLIPTSRNSSRRRVLTSCDTTWPD